MKLLRISSNEATAQFNNNLSADLILEPFSQVALANASFTPAADTLVVNGSNDTITFDTTNAGPTRTINLTHRSYLSDNSDTLSLLQDIERKLNDQLLLSASKEFGGEFKVQAQGSAVAIYYYIMPFTFSTSVGLDDPFQSVGGNIVVNGNNPQIILSQSGASVANDSQRVQSLDSIVKGAGCFRVQLNTLVTNNTASNGMKMVLTSSSLDTIGDSLTAEQDEFSIAIVPDGANFKYVFRDGTGISTDLVDGGNNLIRPQTPTQTAGRADATNDVIQMSVQGGQVRGTIFQTVGGNPTVTPVFAVPYFDEDLFGLIILRGSTAECAVYNPAFTIHQSLLGVNKGNVNANYLENYHESTLIAGAKGKTLVDLNTINNPNIESPPTPDNRQSTFKIDFSGAVSTARYLGLIPPTGNSGIIRTRPNYTNMATLKGLSTFNFVRTQNYVVEFQSSTLESYDGSSFSRVGNALSKVGHGGQFSILKVIPNININNNNNQVNYEPGTLAFIDINNKEPLLLRNIQCRILNSALEPIKQDDLGVLTLYLKPKSEIF